jgi:hypothetical protein
MAKPLPDLTARSRKAQNAMNLRTLSGVVMGAWRLAVRRKFTHAGDPLALFRAVEPSGAENLLERLLTDSF